MPVVLSCRRAGGFRREAGADRAEVRTGRSTGWAHPDDGIGLAALAAGIDGGAATAEEAAIHVVDDDDYDSRCGD